MPAVNHERIALAMILLNQEPATEGVLHALALLDSALPPSGTPERRAAFKAAWAIRSS